MFWLIVLLVCVIVAAVAVVIVAKLYSPKAARGQGENVANYIKWAKAKEQEAWTNAMTAMVDESDAQNALYDASVYGASVYDASPSVLAESAPTTMAPPVVLVPDPEKIDPGKLSHLQKAFFTFWKIPKEDIPKTKEKANQYIMAYKEKLKEDGHIHRIRRWNRLEIVMARFSAEYDVEQLDLRYKALGGKKTILDLLINQVMGLLAKKEIQWKDVSSTGAYELAINRLIIKYPKMKIEFFKFE